MCFCVVANRTLCTVCLSHGNVRISSSISRVNIMSVPHVVNSMPMGCNITRGELDSFLSRSQHGALPSVFNCYFVPGSMPPKCAACQRLIAEHPNGAEAPIVGAVVMGHPMTLPPTAAPPGRLQHPSLTTNGASLNVVRGADNVDVVETKQMYAMFVPIGILVLVWTILMIVFGATGLLVRATSVIVGPCIVATLAIVFSCFPSRMVLRFDKSSRTLHTSRRRAVWVCLSSSDTIPFHSILGFASSPANLRVNGVPYFNVDLVYRRRHTGLPDGGSEAREALTVDCVPYDQADGIIVQWLQYLNEIGVHFTATGLPTAEAV